MTIKVTSLNIKILKKIKKAGIKMIKFYIKNAVEEFQEKYDFVDLENLKIYTSVDKKYYFVTISYFNDEREMIENIAVGSFKKVMKIEFFRKAVENEFINVLMELPID